MKDDYILGKYDPPSPMNPYTDDGDWDEYYTDSLFKTKGYEMDI